MSTPYEALQQTTESDVTFADWAPRLGLLHMSDERRSLIWGLYRLAAWVADHPELPTPAVAATLWPGCDGWEAECAFVDQVAAALAVSTEFEAGGDHYRALARFGRVEVRSTAIRPECMARHRAMTSYADAVTPDDDTTGGDDR